MKPEDGQNLGERDMLGIHNHWSQLQILNTTTEYFMKKGISKILKESSRHGDAVTYKMAAIGPNWPSDGVPCETTI